MCLMAVRNCGKGSGRGRAGLVGVLPLGTMAVLVLVLAVRIVSLVTERVVVIPRAVGTPGAISGGLCTRGSGP